MLDIRSLHRIPVTPYIGSNAVRGAVIGVILGVWLWAIVIGGLIWWLL